MKIKQASLFRIAWFTIFVILTTYVSRAMATGRPPEHKQSLSIANDRSLGVRLTLIANDRSLSSNGDAVFVVLMTNESHEPIHIFAPFGVGESASLSIWAKNVKTGRSLSKGTFIPDSLPPPPDPKKDFVEVLPDHVYGVVLKIPVSNLGIVSPGTYRIIAEYHSPIPDGINYGFPVVSKKYGPIYSNTVTVSVDRGN